MRSYENKKVLIAINLSDSVQFANISPGQEKLISQKTGLIYRNKEPDNKSDVLSFELKPYAIEIWSAH